MNKMWIILKREYAQVVKKKSFLVGLLLTPAIMAAFIFLPMLFVKQEANEPQPVIIVDQSELGIGAKLADKLEDYKLKGTDQAYYDIKPLISIDSMDTERFNAVIDSVRKEIINENAKFALVIKPHPQITDSNVYVISNSQNFITLRRFERDLSGILASMRLEMSNVNLSVDSVLTLSRRLDLQVKNAKGESIDFGTKYFTALTFVLVMYFMIFGYGQLVMRSVIEEKGSRIMEVLMSSVSPFQLMMGKVLGLGAATFTTLLIWATLGVLFYFWRGPAMAGDSAAVQQMIFNPAIAIIYILNMVIGYLLYSTLFALVGSVVNTEKEAQGFIMPVVMMLMLPVIIGMAIIQEPNGTLATTISMIPFFAPTMMTMRAIFVIPSMTHYSLFSGIIFQALVSLILMTLATLAMVWVTGRIFRIGILMYGKRPTLPEVLKWVRYR